MPPVGVALFAAVCVMLGRTGIFCAAAMISNSGKLADNREGIIPIAIPLGPAPPIPAWTQTIARSTLSIRAAITPQQLTARLQLPLTAC